MADVWQMQTSLLEGVIAGQQAGHAHVSNVTYPDPGVVLCARRGSAARGGAPSCPRRLNRGAPNHEVRRPRYPPRASARLVLTLPRYFIHALKHRHLPPVLRKSLKKQQEKDRREQEKLDRIMHRALLKKYWPKRPAAMERQSARGRSGRPRRSGVRLSRFPLLTRNRVTELFGFADVPGGGD
jgi:hypothetical protein